MGSAANGARGWSQGSPTHPPESNFVGNCATNGGASAIGYYSRASGYDSTSVGRGNCACGARGIAVGYGNRSDGCYDIAIGYIACTVPYTGSTWKSPEANISIGFSTIACNSFRCTSWNDC